MANSPPVPAMLHCSGGSCRHISPKRVCAAGRVLEKAWDASEGDEVLAVEFGLAYEFMLPLRAANLTHSSALSAHWPSCNPVSLDCFRCVPARTRAVAESIVRSVTHADGKPFFVNSPELASAAEKKIARSVAVVIRILIRAGERERMLQLARDLAGSLRVFASPNGTNSFRFKTTTIP